MTTKDDQRQAQGEQESVLCPKCGAENTVHPVHVIHGTREEGILKTLLKGDLNKHTCCVCQNRFFLQFPVLFRDDADRYFVYFMPEQATDREQAEKQAIVEDYFGDDEDTQKPECRLAFSMRRFIEKVALYAQGFNDRLIEYVKYQMYQRKRDSIDPVRIELLYDFSCEEKDKLRFLLFDRETGQFQGAAHLPMDVYTELASTFNQNASMQQELYNLFSDYDVNVDSLLP